MAVKGKRPVSIKAVDLEAAIARAVGDALAGLDHDHDHAHTRGKIPMTWEICGYPIPFDRLDLAQRELEKFSTTLRKAGIAIQPAFVTTGAGDAFVGFPVRSRVIPG